MRETMNLWRSNAGAWGAPRARLPARLPARCPGCSCSAKGKIDPTIWGSLQDYVDGKVAQWRYSKRGRKREVLRDRPPGVETIKGDELKRERAALQGAPGNGERTKKVSPITTHPRRRQARRCIVSGNDDARLKPKPPTGSGGLNAAQSHTPRRGDTAKGTANAYCF